MKRMLSIANRDFVVFFPVDAMGEAKQYRRNNPEFKFKRIKDIIQAYPEKAPYRQKLERV